MKKIINWLRKLIFGGDTVVEVVAKLNKVVDRLQKVALKQAEKADQARLARLAAEEAMKTAEAEAEQAKKVRDNLANLLAIDK